MSHSTDRSVYDHLITMDISIQDWVVQLGKLLQETQNLDTAMAASRAMDLSKQEDIATAIKALIEGWPLLKEVIAVESLKLTTNQKNIVLDVIRYFQDEFTKALSTKE